MWQYRESGNMAIMKAFRSHSYKQWYKGLGDKDKRIVDSRIDSARNFGVLTNYKSLDRNLSLYEFKWRSGMRVYFSLLKDNEGEFMLLLLGGNKNSQSQDIRASKRIVLNVLASMKSRGKNEE
jgi:putative addiction module killer protein